MFRDTVPCNFWVSYFDLCVLKSWSRASFFNFTDFEHKCWYFKLYLLPINLQMATERRAVYDFVHIHLINLISRVSNWYRSHMLPWVSLYCNYIQKWTILLLYKHASQIIGSDNGLLPPQHHIIIWTNAGMLEIRPLRTNFNEISIEMQTFSLNKMLLKMSFGKRRPFCLSLNVLKRKHVTFMATIHTQLQACSLLPSYKALIE